MAFKSGDVVIRGVSAAGDVVPGGTYIVDRQEGDSVRLVGDPKWYEAWKFRLREEFDH